MKRSQRERALVLFDSPDEGWPSMDLVAEMLADTWKRQIGQSVAIDTLSLAMPHVARRVAPRSSAAFAHTLDRTVTRFGSYPAAALARSRGARFVHVADHTYAHLATCVPHGRVGVYCHDLDAFRCLLAPELEPRGRAFRAMTRWLVRGLSCAKVVFHSTQAVRRQIEAHALVDSDRLVHAPYGVSPDFHPDRDPRDCADDVLRPLGGAPFILHVGSALPRKRLDVVFGSFARLIRRVPDLWLVQQGATLDEGWKTRLRELGIARRVLQPPKLDRPSLAGLYRRARLVIVPSEAEGFGLPVIEALVAGAPVLASDIDVLREVGGDAASYAPVGEVEAWASRMGELVSGQARAPDRALRLRHAARYTWDAHAKTIWNAYADRVDRVARYEELV